MHRPNRRQIIIAFAGLTVAISLLFLWPTFQANPHVERYEAQPQSLAFDFAESGSKTQTTEVLLTLTKVQLEGMKQAQVFAILNMSILQRYPPTASGSIECWTAISINGNQWIRQHHSSEVAAARTDEWSGDQSETNLQFVELTYPWYMDESNVVDRLNISGSNLIRATATCTSHVSSTGPTSAIVTLGPLFALVTT
ncbi:MAG: hypothetical protein ACYC2H_04340 [Thermoplasmatota archaeon]